MRMLDGCCTADHAPSPAGVGASSVLPMVQGPSRLCRGVQRPPVTVDTGWGTWPGSRLCSCDSEAITLPMTGLCGSYPIIEGPEPSCHAIQPARSTHTLPAGAVLAVT